MNFQIVIDALTKIITDIINFIPNLVNGLIILIVGITVARVVRWLVALVLRQLRFDPLVERAGITGTLRGLGVRMPLSQILAQLIFTLLLLSFLITSTRLMGLEAVARVLEQLLQFLPNIVAATIIFLVGGIVAQFVGNLLGTLATASGVSQGMRVGRLVQHLLSLFVVVLALGQLGIDTAILVTALTIVIASFGLALGLGLGLGARSIVLHVLAGYYIRQRLASGREIVLDTVRGEVSSVGSVNTVVATPDEEVLIPNTLLLESVVRSRRPAPPAAEPPAPAPQPPA